MRTMLCHNVLQTSCHINDAKCQVLMGVLFRLYERDRRPYCTFRMDDCDLNYFELGDSL